MAETPWNNPNCNHQALAEQSMNSVRTASARHNALALIIFVVAIVLSICSQTPSAKGEYNYLFLKYFWILPGIYYLVMRPQYIFAPQLRWIWWLTSLLTLYLFALQTFNYPVIYFGSDIANMVVSSLVVIVSYAFWRQNASLIVYVRILDILIVSTTILAIVSYVLVLRFVDVGQLSYAKIGKNSLATILLSAVVLIITSFRYWKSGKRVFMLGCLFCLVVVMFLLKSRASLLGLAFVVGYYIMKYTRIRTKIIAIAAFAIIVVIVMSIPKYYEIIVENILFANRDSSNIDSLSSGRVTYMLEVLALIPENLIWGVGVRYMDCFPLMQLVQFGIFGALIVAVYLYKAGLLISFRFNKHDPLNLATFLLFWAFMINSLFEAQAPFGPGVKCFILWMMFGFSLADYKMRVGGRNVKIGKEKK
ncbi:MAG: O-antigen ligase family protein [Muribaculaceae bacterium]|nr:O-antigen ligase family protein [Muribaculaceae bacterium]MDE6462966.1 O-antigen ligase family protein [Muribaculaceae bacterium]